MTTESGRKSRIWMPIAAIAVVGLLGLAVVTLGGGDDEAASGNFATYAVERGPLTISVYATGNLRSAQSVTLKNETDERTTVVFLVDEGTRVEEGDLLVELDSAEIEDDLNRQEIQYSQAESEYVQAQSNLEVVRQQAEADTDAAEVAYRLAKLDYEKYLAEGGDYEQELLEADTNITLAKAELERAREELAGSQRLYDANYISRTELQGDELTAQRRELDLKLAEGARHLLEEWTRTRTLEELRSEMDQMEFELTKVEHRTKSDIVDAEATLTSRQLSFEREKDRFERLKRQLAACEVRAPVDGMVVHGTSGDGGRRNQEPLAEGVEVHPRQDLIRLPTADRMLADVKIQEAMLRGLRDRVRSEEGLRVKVTTDAYPDRTFEGRVRRIAVMPDSQSWFQNPDLRVYNTEVEITDDASSLWEGMSCRAEIIVEELEDATYVPLQAVTRVSGERVVYVSTPDGPEARRVEVGLDNNRMMQLVSGVDAGESVLLNPPLERSSRPERREEQPEEEAPPGAPGPGTETAQADEDAERS